MSPGKARPFNKVAVGGTFDTLHRGHKKLIEKALELGNLVVLGLTTDTMLEMTPKRYPVTRYRVRAKRVKGFLREKGAVDRVKITPINDPYGPTITDNEIEALIVSRETVNRSEEINKIRQRKGFNPLHIIVIEMVVADDGAPISSTRIRHGQIDREGQHL